MSAPLDQITRLMVESFEDKIASLPSPPPGWYYTPGEIKEIRREGDKFVIETAIELQPIIK